MVGAECKRYRSCGQLRFTGDFGRKIGGGRRRLWMVGGSGRGVRRRGAVVGVVGGGLVRVADDRRRRFADRVLTANAVRQADLKRTKFSHKITLNIILGRPIQPAIHFGPVWEKKNAMKFEFSDRTELPPAQHISICFPSPDGVSPSKIIIFNKPERNASSRKVMIVFFGFFAFRQFKKRAVLQRSTVTDIYSDFFYFFFFSGETIWFSNGNLCS